MKAIDYILIYGAPSGGLFGMRQIRKEWPESQIYLFAPKTDIGVCSSAYDHFIQTDTSDDIWRNTTELLVKLRGAEVRAFIFSNKMLEFIIANHEKLFSIVRFENSYEVFKKIVDKTAADQLCRELGIKRPDEYDLDECNRCLIHYPVVIKPLDKQLAKGASKCEFLETESRLNQYLRGLSQMGISQDNLVCQQVVRGNNRWEYGYGGYFCDGKPLIDVCFHQFRQVPQGLCCYIREMNDEALEMRIKEMISPFLAELGYNGFIEFDVKEDEITHELFLLDINPRPWGSSDMLGLKLEGSTVFHPTISAKKIIWRKPIIELKSFGNFKNTPYSICKELTGDKGYESCINLFWHGDIKPFWVGVLEEIKGIFKSWFKL